MRPGIVVIHIWGTFDFVVVKAILESFGAFVSKCPISKNTADCRAKRGEIWESGTLVIHNCIGWFDLVGFKVNLGSLSALVSKCPISQKRLTVEQNGVKFGN